METGRGGNPPTGSVWGVGAFQDEAEGMGGGGNPKDFMFMPFLGSCTKTTKPYLCKTNLLIGLATEAGLVGPPFCNQTIKIL